MYNVGWAIPIVVGDSPPYGFYAEFPAFYGAINIDGQRPTLNKDLIICRVSFLYPTYEDLTHTCCALIYRVSPERGAATLGHKHMRLLCFSFWTGLTQSPIWIIIAITNHIGE
jgi:hypothetical protein